jgi:CHAT domain-containing protein
LTEETFENAQWAQSSEAAASLAQIAIRSTKGSPKLAGLVRERQDLLSELQVQDKHLIATRRSMLALIDRGEPHEAHPAYWAPFVVVGEGAATTR